jgi:hypothetical protein
MEISLQKSDDISFPKRELGQKIYNDMLVTSGDKHPSYSTVKNWVSGFERKHLNTENEEHSGRPPQVTITVNMDAIHSMILGD